MSSKSNLSSLLPLPWPLFLRPLRLFKHFSAVDGVIANTTEYPFTVAPFSVANESSTSTVLAGLSSKIRPLWMWTPGVLNRTCAAFSIVINLLVLSVGLTSTFSLSIFWYARLLASYALLNQMNWPWRMSYAAMRAMFVAQSDESTASSVRKNLQPICIKSSVSNAKAIGLPARVPWNFFMSWVEVAMTSSRLVRKSAGHQTVRCN